MEQYNEKSRHPDLKGFNSETGITVTPQIIKEQLQILSQINGNTAQSDIEFQSVESAPNFEAKSKIMKLQASKLTGYDSSSTNNQEFKFSAKPKQKFEEQNSDSDYGWEEFEAFQDFELRKKQLKD